MTTQQYYQDNKEKVKQKQKKYYEKNKETIKAKSKIYNNKPEIKLKNACYKENNKEKLQLQNKKWYLKNKEHVAKTNKIYRLKRKYNLTLEDWDNLLKSQNNQCKICSIDFSYDTHNTKPFVDHCHNTNNVRGMLCHLCNAGLGYFKDNVDVLQKATKYLNNFNGD
jgi:predicted RNase H-like nuclease (RuvC/YqgF family)